MKNGRPHHHNGETSLPPLPRGSEAGANVSSAIDFDTFPASKCGCLNEV
jgi:hypothetical protein